jgi:excisionase family DNA binding protein
MSAQPSYTEKQARDDCHSYQRLAGIVSRLINRDLNRLDDATAKKYFKPSVFQTVHSLHGFFNGRDLKKKDLIVSHQFVAPFFDYKGDPENAGTFMARRLDGLADAELAAGHRYFEIERADGVTLLYTHYKSHPLLDAARLIGVSVPTVRALAERGELAGWKIGRNYKFSKTAVDEFLNRSARPLAA